jgi:hypothetical protein
VAFTWARPPPPPPPPPRSEVVLKGAPEFAFRLLLLLPLFLFRPNRSARAWWVWLPAGVTALVGTVLGCLLLDSDFGEAICSFTIGLAAVWLLMPYLKSRHRLITFLKTLPMLAACSLVAFVPALLAKRTGWLDFRSYLAIALGGGELCRHNGPGVGEPVRPAPVWPPALHLLVGRLDPGGVDFSGRGDLHLQPARRDR